jgi:DNA-binding transcriptional ArsR family regulator
MNEKIFGNKTALLVLLQLYHHHETHARAIATDLGTSLSPVQNQLDRFEQAGVLISKKVGQARVYAFNMKSPLTKPFKELVRVIYETLSKEDHQHLFPSRRKPRVKGKPVLARKGT